MKYTRSEDIKHTLMRLAKDVLGKNERKIMKLETCRRSAVRNGQRFVEKKAEWQVDDEACSTRNVVGHQRSVDFQLASRHESGRQQQVEVLPRGRY